MLRGVVPDAERCGIACGDTHLAVVGDLDSGAVLFIGEGKGGDSLKKFRNRVKHKAKLAIDTGTTAGCTPVPAKKASTTR